MYLFKRLIYSRVHIFLYSNIKLKGAYRYDGEHSVSLGVSEKDVNEGDDLQRFAQTHAVGQNTAKPAAAAKAVHWLHQVVVQETDSTNLKSKTEQRRKKWW